MRIKTFLVALVSFLAFAQISVGAAKLPRFLPYYYAPAFAVGLKNLALVSQTEVNGVDEALYSMRDGSLSLSVENVKCDSPKCHAFFDNILGHLNTVIKNNSGRFVDITDSEACVEVDEDKVNRIMLIYILPASVQVWTYSITGTAVEQFAPRYELVRRFVDRQRYEQALAAGNIEMGYWGTQIHNYANQLFRDGHKLEGLTVLKNLLATMPYNYEAHMDFVKNTDDNAAAANSAAIVFKNAEDSNLISRAAKYLGKDIADINSIPILDKNETGLQLILVPLHPCNPWLLEEAAATFRQITDIPVKIRRLKEDWKWADPERIPYERTIQSRLVRLKETDIDFTGWTKDRYIEEMRKAVETKDALSKYYVNNLIRKIKSKQGQYSVGPYLTRFSGILASYRGADKRTMYVGITETNIYSGDENFLFSQGGGESQASILSYYMMLSRTLDEEYQSRQRLTERIAKELVPASLKQLNIPRSTDPTCPYSYSSGVTRLDQKTLKLSELVKQALDKLKDPAKTSDAPK